MIDISHIQRYRLVYVATPFTLYKAGLEAAFIDACKLSARLIQAGIVNIRCPIAEAYPIALHGGLDPLDISIWQPFCDATLIKSDALLIGKLQGWDSSTGVRHEFDTFKRDGKPIYAVNPETLAVKAMT